MSLPYAVKLEIAFTTDALDPLPDWLDLTDRLRAVTWGRGKSKRDAVSEAGKATFRLDSDDGALLVNNPDGLYYGYIRPNRRVRFSIQLTSSDTLTPVWEGYADSWQPERSGQADACDVVLSCTDRFKLLSDRTNTGTTVQEQTHLRLKAILDAGDTGGLTAIMQPYEYSLNDDGYTARTLVAQVYTGGETLQNLIDAVHSDGGQAFIDGDGVYVFQSYLYRSLNARATTSQATFGNTTGSIPVLSDLDPDVSEDDVYNYITVTLGGGTQPTPAQDATSIDSYGQREADIGNTLLTVAEGPGRVSTELALRKDPRPWLEQLMVDCVAEDDAAELAVSTVISDRFTVENIPGNLSQGLAQDYWVEALNNDMSFEALTWTCSFTLTGTLDAPVVIP